MDQPLSMHAASSCWPPEAASCDFSVSDCIENLLELQQQRHLNPEPISSEHARQLFCGLSVVTELSELALQACGGACCSWPLKSSCWVWSPGPREA